MDTRIVNNLNIIIIIIIRRMLSLFFLLSTEGECILSFTSQIHYVILITSLDVLSSFICPNPFIGVVGSKFNLWSGLIFFFFDQM
jgi:hypothetical protein